MRLAHSFRGFARGAFLFLCGISVVCTAQVPAIPLEVEYAGCRSVLLPGPVCKLDPSRELRLWIGAPPEARIEIQAGEGRIDTAGETVGGGQRFSLTVPPGEKRVDVLVEAQEGQASWSLSLANAEIRQARQEMFRDLIREIDQTARPLYASVQERRFAAAREMLDGLGLPPEAPAEFLYHVRFFRGLLAEKQGDYRSAFTEIQKAVEIARRVKEERFQWMAEEKLALLLRGVGRSRESAELFELIGPAPHGATRCDQARLLNNRAWSALLARESGESAGDPTPLFARALEMYEPCKDFTSDQRLSILINLALAHWHEGRLVQAKELLTQAHELKPQATLLLELWRLDLVARIALREGQPAEALRRFEGLENLALRTSSPDGMLRAAFGQARSYEALKDRTAALETLQEAEVLLDEQSLQVPLHEGRDTFMATRQAVVNLHVALLLDADRREEALDVVRHARSRMLRQLKRSGRLASLMPEQRVRWEGLLMDYQQKRAALENRAKDDWKLPIDQLRREQDARAAEAEAATRLLDEAFLILEDPEERSEEVLPPPRPGELILAYHPLPRGWAGFAADGKTVEVHRFDLPPGALSNLDELERRLLLPFRVPIKRAKRIRVLPSGLLQEVDFHALPFDGDILLASAPVIYGLDLPVSTGPAQAPGRRALLVADPRDDLPGTREETRTVRRELESWSRPWITEELKSLAASAEAVRSRLPAVDLLHYAGHGTFSGSGGWESSLLLSEETRLTLGEFLTLERVPVWVVLSGCDTGRASTETPVESLGLAHAFLLAGSQAVIGSTRQADDREVPRFFSELYQQWSREPDLAVALQRAQLSWRKRNPGADWRGFRLFEP